MKVLRYAPKIWKRSKLIDGILKTEISSLCVYLTAHNYMHKWASKEASERAIKSAHAHTHVKRFLPCFSLYLFQSRIIKTRTFSHRCVTSSWCIVCLSLNIAVCWDIHAVKVYIWQIGNEKENGSCKQEFVYFPSSSFSSNHAIAYTH